MIFLQIQVPVSYTSVRVVAWQVFLILAILIILLIITVFATGFISGNLYNTRRSSIESRTEKQELELKSHPDSVTSTSVNPAIGPDTTVDSVSSATKDSSPTTGPNPAVKQDATVDAVSSATNDVSPADSRYAIQNAEREDEEPEHEYEFDED